MSSVAQVLRQADSLKATISDSGKNISELWVTRQRLEDLYKKILLMDLEYALDKKVEQDLWNHAFKNQINILQTQAKDKQNAKRGEIQASLNLFLETASGFYLQFLQQICTTFKLDLPFRRKSAVFGVMKEKCPLKTRITPPKKSSCLYVCQHCLVHLGDIARYRQQVEQAQTYYQHAANLVPQNGQPYNQLAILEAARGNKLSTVFYYIRSLAVRHPFPVAATNLEKFYAKLTKDIGELKDKFSMSEVINAFLQFNALVHLSSDLNKAASLKEKLLSSLPSHVTSQSFTSTVLIQFVAITIFSLHHVQKELSVAPSSNQQSVSKDEQRCFHLMFSFMICVLDILLQNTPKQEPKAREFFTLPAIKIIFDWLHLNKDCIDRQVLMNSGFWTSLAKLLNNLQTLSNKENTPDSVKYEDAPLPEDCEVRCFQPIEKAHCNYSFSRVSVDNLPPSVEVHLRYQRLIEHGKWLAMEFSSSNLFSCTTLKSGNLQFTAPGIQNKDTVTPEKKFGRQNVAMQAIIQKQEQKDAANSEIGNPVKIMDNPSLFGIDRNIPQSQITSQTSPKYFLGIPTNEPQFMKLKHPKTSAIASSQMRFNGSAIQQPPPPFSGYIAPPQANGPTPQQHMVYPGQNSSQAQLPPRMTPGGQSHGVAPSNQGPRLSPANQSNPARTSPSGSMGHGISPQSLPQCPSFMIQPPVFSQSDPFQISSSIPGPLLGSQVTSPDSQTGQMTSAAQQQMRAAMMRQPPPTLPLNSLSPSQVMAAMALTNQLNAQQQQFVKSSQQQQQGLSSQIKQQPLPLHHPHFQQAPGTERAQTSPKDKQPNQMSALKTGIPVLGGSAGFGGMSNQGSPMAPPSFKQTPPPSSTDSQSHLNMFLGFSPLAIQPPRPSFQEQRLNSSFQGHAEGTPKPGGYYPERRETESSNKTESQASSQPGVYSLFSNSPWAVPISAASDSKSLGSSPFSSAASSIRNSPEHSLEPASTGTPAFDLGLRFSSGDAHWGAQGPSENQHHDDNNQYLNSIQSIWNASAPSPLERLLEQQKQKRQNEPH